MLLNAFIDQGIKALEPLYPTPEARQMILMLCEETLGIKNYTHIVNPDYEISKANSEMLLAKLEDLSRGMPLQYALGYADFCGLRFRVTPAVLIPRPETELLVRDALQHASRIKRMREAYGKGAEPVRVLDLCTGSGCIAWSVALNLPGSVVVGTDISEDALEVARTQDFAAELKSRQAAAPTFVKSDVLDTEQEFPYGPFDIILSNPPYILPSEKVQMRVNVLGYEPEGALFVPQEDPMLYYRAIAKWSERFLNPEGKALTEINAQLADETKEVFRSAGFSGTEVLKDYFYKNRFVLYYK
ncbi:MAG: peptide chain release factor N(5)-glutamine methyltransferase [Bacteroidales bacterium]|nr:peptide chain release factor N(5)-glutamine methyltransferase [Bacteroidales bacterium]